MVSLGEKIQYLIENLGIERVYAFWIKNLLVLLGIALLSILANYIAKKIILKVLKEITKKTKSTWDDILYEKGVFTRLSHLAPAIVLYQLTPIALKSFPGWIPIILGAVKIYFIIIFSFVIDSFLSAVNDIYNTYEISKSKPIKGIIQAFKILFYLISGILILSVILDESPAYLLTGLGALSAILLLIFKDSILGFVASLQLSGNNMVKPGDWITMSKYGADGIVKEITLFSVKVENFDKTLTMIPTYNMITDAFQNWRNMQESGVRRVIRNMYIDIYSIEKINTEKISQILLKLNSDLNSNNLPYTPETNIELFKIYTEFYLKNSPEVSKEQTLIVRLLDATEKGIPIQFYFFMNTTDWQAIENFQYKMLSHFLVILPIFGLKVFQNRVSSQ